MEKKWTYTITNLLETETNKKTQQKNINSKHKIWFTAVKCMHRTIQLIHAAFSFPSYEKIGTSLSCLIKTTIFSLLFSLFVQAKNILCVYSGCVCFFHSHTQQTATNTQCIYFNLNGKQQMNIKKSLSTAHTKDLIIISYKDADVVSKQAHFEICWQISFNLHFNSVDVLWCLLLLLRSSAILNIYLSECATLCVFRYWNKRNGRRATGEWDDYSYLRITFNSRHLL